jgi:hypothetical protein
MPVTADSTVVPNVALQHILSIDQQSQELQHSQRLTGALVIDRHRQSVRLGREKAVHLDVYTWTVLLHRALPAPPDAWAMANDPNDVRFGAMG